MTKNIFPIATDVAQLPYVLYRRVNMEQTPTKSLRPGAESVNMEVVCFAETYAGSLDLAEAVRASLEYNNRMRSCVMIDSEENYAADAFVQTLMFNIKL